MRGHIRMRECIINRKIQRVRCILEVEQVGIVDKIYMPRICDYKLYTYFYASWNLFSYLFGKFFNLLISICLCLIDNYYIQWLHILHILVPSAAKSHIKIMASHKKRMNIFLSYFHRHNYIERSVTFYN